MAWLAFMLHYWSVNLAGISMASVKKGYIVRSPQWWKHLKDWKRVFWKRQRRAQRKDAYDQMRT